MLKEFNDKRKYKLQKAERLHIRILLLWLLVGTLIIFNLCIDPFEPDINEEENLITVDGSIIKGRAKQTVTISRASSLMEPEFAPVENCNVKIIDDSGNEYMCYEESGGTYVAEIDDEFLQYNRNYKLVFITPEGNTYESALETLLESAPVDSLYFINESQYSSSLEEMEERIQFYVDLKAPEHGARYYRWELTETFEYHSPQHIHGYFDGQDTIYRETLYDSLFICWTTQKLNGLYSSNTVNLIKNEKKKISLNYVNRKSIKLSVKYSLLIRQYALNEGAYNYWNQARVEMQESGGLYTTQPARSISNIANINDKEEKVLGFFWASSCSEKRIFLEEPSLYAMPPDYCNLDTFDVLNYLFGPFPVYLVIDVYNRYWTADQECFDCTMRGGSLEKPDFW
jgi:hypothetical protein